LSFALFRGLKLPAASGMSGRELFTVKRLESLRNPQEKNDYGELFGEQAYAGRFTDFGGSHGATGESPITGERVVA
jgi:hypothetical protein